jgi:hypothetical protein
MSATVTRRTKFIVAGVRCGRIQLRNGEQRSLWPRGEVDEYSCDKGHGGPKNADEDSYDMVY